MYIYIAIAMKCYEPIHVGEYHPPICLSNIVILLQNTTMLEGVAVHNLLGIKCWDYMIIMIHCVEGPYLLDLHSCGLNLHPMGPATVWGSFIVYPDPLSTHQKKVFYPTGLVCFPIF
jgi:hypothetical protein